MTTKKVAFIGLGAMGSRIAKRLSLQQSSFNIFVYDSNRNTVDRFLKDNAPKNIFDANSLHSTVIDANYVLSCLPTSNVVKHVIENVYIDNKHPFSSSGCIWMDCTSGDAKTSKLISKQYFSNNNNTKLYFMDTPISGGPTKAIHGTLSCMVGCDEQNKDIFDQCNIDILQHISASAIRAGNVGAGHALKCINNLLNVTHLLALSEGLKCIDDHNIDIDKALQVISTSSGSSLMSKERYPKHIIEDNYFYDFQLGLMNKDVQNAIDLMDNDNDDDYPIANVVNKLMNNAMDRFGYNADYTEAGRLYLDLKDKTLKKH